MLLDKLIEQKARQTDKKAKLIVLLGGHPHLRGGGKRQNSTFQ